VACKSGGCDEGSANCRLSVPLALIRSMIMRRRPSLKGPVVTVFRGRCDLIEANNWTDNQGRAGRVTETALARVG
jgi:hypothetical protein